MAKLFVVEASKPVCGRLRERIDELECQWKGSRQRLDESFTIHTTNEHGSAVPLQLSDNTIVDFVESRRGLVHLVYPNGDMKNPPLKVQSDAKITFREEGAYARERHVSL